MAIPDFQTLMLPVLKLSAEKEMRISDAVNLLADQFSLKEDDRSQLLPSGRQTTFANRVHWAKSYLGKAGLVELTKRAHFRVTEEGERVLQNPPQKIDIKFLSQFPEFISFRDGEDSPANNVGVSATAVLTPDELMRNAAKGLETALAEDLLKRMQSSAPAFFESLVVRLLLSMGYGGSAANVERALVGGSGDGGVDGVIDQDALGLDRIYVQAKRYKDGNSVGSGAIRDFFGSLDRFKATKGLFVTTSSFSQSARETAEILSKRIVLIDGEQLTRLMIRHDVGCTVEEILYIKKVDEDFFD